MKMFLLPVLVLASLLAPINCFFEGIYCGVDNCYDVLNTTREATRDEIIKSYRRLARKHHPDVHRSVEAKKNANEVFTKIATAYEILRDEEQRREYNYMLDNPDEVYRNYYYYYRLKYAPKVDVRIVIAVIITIISIIQYYVALSRYNDAINYFLSQTKYRNRAAEIAREKGLLDHGSAAKKLNRLKSKEEIKAREEAILRQVIEEKTEIRGAYSKPTYRDILWIQLILLPITISEFVLFHLKWFYKFSIKKMEYSEEDQKYLIRRNMKESEAQFNSHTDEEIAEYLKLKLWVKSNFKEWKQKEEDEMKKLRAENSRYKRHRRWMKKGGPGQITFGED